MYLWGQWMSTAGIRVSAGDTKETIGNIKKMVQFMFPVWVEEFFDFTFLEETFNRQYISDEKTARIIGNFAIIGILVACPVAWYVMSNWLQSFAYRTSISVLVFIITVIVVFAITFLTLTWQSLKAARSNPVDALKYE